MDWQQITSISIVVATAGLLAWSQLRPRRWGRRKRSCAGCGAAASPPRESIILHARKGERPEVRVRDVTTPAR